jgi:2,4-dienoyl-CoA reductase-like NADH-dependent reductase (Old Yellow Enzyme family)/nucleotide-binding universal stress UspA family protein
VLFTSFRLGPYTLGNRLVALPVFSGYALPDGRASELLIDHYAALARSGVAMAVVANAAVTADGRVAVNNLRADADEFLPGLERLARAIQRRGALAVLQLNHGGRFARTLHPLAPSALDAAHIPFHLGSLKEFMEFFPLEHRFGLTRDFVQRMAAWTCSMSAAEKETVAAAFGAAAARACAAGFDAVELHGATGYLLTQFLSGFSHKDASGAPAAFDERMRFPLQVVRAVRRRLPAGFLLGFRLLLREWVPGGIDLEEALAFAAQLAAEGVGYFSPSAATYHSMFLPEVRATTARAGYLAEDCRALKDHTPVPVIVSGRVLTPRSAEDLLAEGAGDLIGLGRGLRADPRWVSKARSGRPVKACRNCNLCLRGVVLEQGFTCTRWPGWVRQRADLEQRLLKRDTARTLWVVAGARDLGMLRTPVAAAGIRARPGTATTVLFLKSAEPDLGYDKGVEGFMAWSRALWRRRGIPDAQLSHKTMAAQGPPESLIDAQMAQGGFGAVILGRNHLELWRERSLYRQRAKAVSLIGTHPRWSQVLVPLDLGLVSLFVLRHLEQSFMTPPEFQLDFLHVLQSEEGRALKRWREIHKILGWQPPAPLRVVPRKGDVAATILHELRQGDFGTLVMGKRGLSRIKQLLLGSVSAAVLQGLTNQTLLLID